MRSFLVPASFAILAAACAVPSPDVETTDSTREALPTGITVGVSIGRPALELSTPSPWLVLLCKTNDDASEPKPISFFEDLYTTKGLGKGGVADFFADQSYGKISLAGSIVKGWYTVPKSRAELDDHDKVLRYQRAEACVSAAIAKEGAALPMKKYFGIIAVYNVTLDSGIGGWDTIVDGQGVPAGHNLIVASGFDRGYAVAFNTHEMLHGYGLQHAHDDAGADYGDDWSIMGTGQKSFLGPFGTPPACVGPFFPLHPCEAGPGMTAFEREAVGWMPKHRIYTWGSAGASGFISETIELAPVNEPSTPGYLHLKVPVDVATGRYYSVDFKKRSGWDRNVDGDAVAVREIRGGQSYLQTSQGNRGTFAPGTYFSSYADNIRIRVLSIDPVKNTATVNVSLDHATKPKPKGGGKVPSLPADG